MKHPLQLFGLTEAHLAAIGAASIAWTTIDSALAHFLAELIPLPDMASRHIIVAATDTRAKIEMARSFARLRLRDDTKFHALDGLLNLIDNDLRPRRNRIIHDNWVASDPPESLRFSPKFYKEPFKARQMKLAHIEPMSTDAVRQLGTEIVAASVAVNLATGLHLRDEKDGPQPWPDIRFALTHTRNLAPD
jgi:hypothetical protein